MPYFWGLCVKTSLVKKSFILLFGLLFCYPLLAVDHPGTDDQDPDPNPASINLGTKFRINTQLIVNLIGGGATNFSYDIVEQAPGNELSGIVSREYSAKITTSQFGISLAVAYKGLNLGGTFMHERIKSSDIESIYTTEDGRIQRGGQLTLNKGNWPNSRNYFGPLIAYDFQIGKNTFLTPNYQYLWYNFQANGTFLSFDTFANNTFSYDEIFVNRRSNVFGLQLKFGLGLNTLLFVEGKYLADRFEINENYFTEQIQNVETSSGHFSIGFGMQINFFQY